MGIYNYVDGTFSGKDNLQTGNPEKIVRGSHFETEFVKIRDALGNTLDTPGYTDNNTYGIKNNTWVQIRNSNNEPTDENGSPIGGGGDCTLSVIGDAGATYALTAADESRILRLTSPTDVTLTLSEADALTMTIGATTQWRQMGDGAITLVPAGTLTVNYKTGLKTNGKNSQVMLMRVGTYEFDLTGDCVA